MHDDVINCLTSKFMRMNIINYQTSQSMTTPNAPNLTTQEKLNF